MAYALVDSCSMKKPSPIEVAVARFQLSQNWQPAAPRQERDAVALAQSACSGRKRARPPAGAAAPRTARQRCRDSDSDDEIEADDYNDDRGEREKQRAVMATILELLQAAIVKERRTK